jgi:hypothetical protein
MWDYEKLLSIKPLKHGCIFQPSGLGTQTRLCCDVTFLVHVVSPHVDGINECHLCDCWYLTPNLGLKFCVLITEGTSWLRHPSRACYWPCRIPCLFEVELGTASLSLFKPIKSLEIWFKTVKLYPFLYIHITHLAWLRLLVHAIVKKCLSNFCAP